MRMPNPTIGNVGTVSVAPQTSPTETTQNSPGGPTVQPGRGQQIRRNIAQFFHGIADKFKGLGNRISKYSADRKRAANTRSAEGAAKNVLKALGNEHAAVKMTTLLPKLLQTAAKLNPENPVGKAVELLVAAQADLTESVQKEFAATEWSSMGPSINAVIDRRMGRLQALERTFASFNQVNEGDVTTDGEVAGIKHAVNSLLTALQRRTDDAFAEPFETARGDLANYLASPGVNKGTVLRSDSPTTKAIRSAIKSTYPSCEGKITKVLTNALRRTNKLPNDLFDGPKFKNKKDITAQQFETIAAAAEDLMTAMIGGDDAQSNVEAANRLPSNTVKLLQEIDAQVRERFPDDDVIAANAFIGSLFLRFQVPFVTTEATSPERSPKERAVGVLVGSLLQSTFNSAITGEAVEGKIAQFSSETSVVYANFVAKYSEAVMRFREAVLAREVE